jgi:hypothetical protein
VFEILGSTILQRLDATGVKVPDGDNGGVDANFATLSEGAKCFVEGITGVLNNATIFKDTEMQQWFKYVDGIRKDKNEEESLSFYRHLDETLASGNQIVGTPVATKATMATENQLSLKELYEEAICRL